MTAAFTNGISQEALCHYLSRAVTADNIICSDTQADDIRMLVELGVRFVGRAAYVWKLESDDEEHFRRARLFADLMHQRATDTILQACVFEAVYPGVDKIAVPAWVFTEFDLPVELRCFRFADMVSPEFSAAHTWMNRGKVPDITFREAQMWFYYRARCYLDAGYEALHLGQVHLIGGRDPGYREFAKLVDRIRRYAAQAARRRWVLLDAHTHGIAHGERLLFDFHSRPISVRPVVEQPERLVLVWKGRSEGGISPSGWRCASLP